MAGAVEWADGLGNHFWQPVTGEDERLVRVPRYDFTWDAVWRGPDVFLPGWGGSGPMLLPGWGRSNPVLYRRRKRAVRVARRREKQLLRARVLEVREEK